MNMAYVAFSVWIIWGVIWYTSALFVKPNATGESKLSCYTHELLMFLSFWLVSPFGFWQAIREPMDKPEDLEKLGISGIILVFLGLSFTLWARYHLGREWSSAIAVKKAGQLVITGPYRFMKHPIYAGLLCAFIGSAMIGDNIAGRIGFMLAAVVMGYRASRESKLLAEAFHGENKTLPDDRS